MANQGFVFCPDCLVFGNDGPNCKDDDHLHSWCWEQNSTSTMQRDALRFPEEWQGQWCFSHADTVKRTEPI